jgi:hypothetical protein
MASHCIALHRFAALPPRSRTPARCYLTLMPHVSDNFLASTAASQQQHSSRRSRVVNDPGVLVCHFATASSPARMLHRILASRNLQATGSGISSPQQSWRPPDRPSLSYALVPPLVSSLSRIGSCALTLTQTPPSALAGVLLRPRRHRCPHRTHRIASFRYRCPRPRTAPTSNSHVIAHYAAPSTPTPATPSTASAPATSRPAQH